ncbi:uncharacterized protein NPIL_498821 [Nephila pilipes]|uniref:Uncharacterized protein n=1 Tax=Nephila pilipes TaxID=299642 RepID=A0A8X6QQL1_NEPPI|nr:uncharacterized protein NPIL_498821 [Nephila pilipes]
MLLRHCSENVQHGQSVKGWGHYKRQLTRSVAFTPLIRSNLTQESIFNVLMFTMEHHRKLPEDGCLKPITSSSISIPCNIMIIKVPDEMKEPGEMTYQLATYDRSIEGMEWPADKYVDQMIPNLPKVKAPKESRLPLKKITDTDFMKKRIEKYRNEADAIWSKHQKKKSDNDSSVQTNFEFSKSIPNSPFFKAQKESRLEVKEVTDTDFIKTKKKCWKQTIANRSKFQKKKSADIDPWIQKPWENQFFNFGVNPVISMNTSTWTSNLPFNNMDIQSPAFESYGHETLYMPTNNTIYKNNYTENPSSEGISGNSCISNCGENQINELLMNIMPNFCQPSCNNGLFMNDPLKHKGLLGDYPNDPTAFVRNPSENLSLISNHEKKRFPRKKSKVRKTGLHNFYRNHAFEFRDNM